MVSVLGAGGAAPWITANTSSFAVVFGGFECKAGQFLVLHALWRIMLSVGQIGQEVKLTVRGTEHPPNPKTAIHSDRIDMCKFEQKYSQNKFASVSVSLIGDGKRGHYERGLFTGGI